MIKALLKLSRIYLSLAISFSAFAGYIFYSHSFEWGALSAFMGVFLLSAGASALNQYQERHWDALMKRTQKRPLPSNQLSPRFALLIAMVLGASGTLLLFFFTTPITALLGVINMVWYNAVYTPLKRRTSFVVLIGGITGAIPPMMGWVAAGGYLWHPDILFVAAFMFFWQIPHFILLLIKFGKEYEAAGFPAITSLVDERRVKYIIFIWILGTCISTMVFPFFHIVSSVFLIFSLILLNAMLIFLFYKSTFNQSLTFGMKSAFRSLYLYQVLILAILMIEALAQ